MAYEDRQQEFPLPGEDGDKRKSERFLPKYFRTETNSKFLSSTIDQLLQPGVAEKLNGYFGRKVSKAYSADDNYIGDVTKEREDYQLEPAAVIKDSLGNIEFYRDYNDYVNQIANFGGVNTDHSKLNAEEFYAWDPHIDWDKFTNFREYYWQPNGPQVVAIKGEEKEIESTYTVSLQNNGDTYTYIFTPDGLTNNPVLKLFRGVTYRFEIDTPGLPLTFRTQRTLDDAFLLEEGVTAQSVESGVIELTLGPETPNEIFYVADNDINLGGLIKVANIEESQFIDVEAEILGKKSYVTRDGWALSNGMKIRFQGDVTPARYADSQWYVEGVGKEINLVSDVDVEVSFPVGIDLTVPFDTEEGFDREPFSAAIGYPRDKDYITINRASGDGNFWSRYNRWFHKSVVEQSAQINGQPMNVDQALRANRPIIEFDSGLKLKDFGTKTKEVIDVIDTFTTDAFSTIEGSLGYNVDGVELTQGMRIMFLADPDPLVNGRIFEVNFITFSGGVASTQISLKETEDTLPLENENVLVVRGEEYAGTMWYFNGTEWKRAQEKTAVNQPPLFEIFDVDGNSFADESVYPASNFKGCKIFSYREGTGTDDTVLGFPLTYRSINNIGDIVFDFDFNTDILEYQINSEPVTKEFAAGYLRKYSSRDTFNILGAWTKADRLSEQAVILQYVNDNTRKTYPINCYDKSALLSDLVVKVFVNNDILVEGTDYEITSSVTNIAQVNFLRTINRNDIILIKCNSHTPKNENGYYEIAPNLERNPLNDNVSNFTLGEVTDHVTSITENVPGFRGVFPGVTNLRDIADQSKYGRKFIKHSSPLNLSLYHLLDREANIVKSIRYSKREYGKFKRQFLEVAETLGYEGPVKQHVDRIIAAINKDKINTMSFYFSDMIAHGPAIRTGVQIEDIDVEYFALSLPYSHTTINTHAVSIYLNGEQLLHGKDYTFNDEGFVIVTATKQFGDLLEIFEYETTNGSYIPPTPTKLGLYPKYEPRIYDDSTYKETVTVIEGHDGSIIKAYGDYRDALILELERRIFNNIKVEYDPSIFDINDYVGGEFRDTQFTRQEINNPLITDFLQWLNLVDEDYTDNSFFEREDPFTFNYSGLRGPNGEFMPGWWRGVYKHLFDTDRPHTHPWEMLGFTIKPTWWEEQYGPAPYTSENKILWEDLERGIIRETGKVFSINKKYVRTGLSKFIPVDDSGNLLSPSDANVAQKYNSLDIKNSYEFGDYAPVELAWRNSAEYPFALLASWAINNPTRLLATGFDRSRQVRNALGQIVYSETGHHIRLEDIVFPNTPNDSTELLASGIINYISGYMASSVTASFKEYNTRLKSIKNYLGFKLAGFTDKDKFKIILDSRTPLNEGNVFVPEESYQIFLNTSSPLRTVNYSGVMVEKTASGFIIRGYNRETPIFKYFEVFKTQNDPLINVGGVSEPYSEWASAQTYVEGKNVEYNGTYYKVIETHTTTTTFDATKYAKLPKLPTSGGRSATFGKRFVETRELEMPYGTLVKTVQEVVDFLLGYGAWLEAQGFKFEYYDGDEKIISDWATSAREFLFWTTQNWNEGALIAFSPAADEINFTTEYSIVDNIYDNFYGYSILKADGKKLVEEFSRVNRSDPNNFALRPTDSADGVYAIQVPIIQKEHVILLSNSTVFGDVIYQPATGYRQERIKVLGYRTTDWDGSLNIPGFMYDSAKVTEWTAWKDYSIGDLVKYKEFYYTAKNKITGGETFSSDEWSRLSEKPSSGLVTNFDYKVNQFADFYDLDTDNFDVNQQKLAQHLIGYQKRKYLENIINDDVSQYKFYQGMIADKGTTNALTKLFDVLSSADKESLDFYEEWAIKEGQYGASEGFEEVEFKLDESKFRAEPQAFELLDSTTGIATDLVYRIKPYEVYKKPINYTSNFLPVKDAIEYTRDAGFVNYDDVDFVVAKYDDILDLTFADVDNKEYIWVGTEGTQWNVYQHVITDYIITSLKGNATAVSIGAPDKNQFRVTLNTAPVGIEVGDIVGVYDLVSTDLVAEDSSRSFPVGKQETAPVEGFFKVLEVSLDDIVIDTNLTINDIDQCRGLLTVLRPVRVSTLSEANSLAQTGIEEGDLIWVDRNTVDWTVIKNNQPYYQLQKIQAEETGTDNEFGGAIAVDNRNTVVAVGSPGADNGKVFVYTRGGNAQNAQFTQTLEPILNNSADGERFGDSIAISPDGKYLIVGSPEASNVKSTFRGEFNPTTDYQNGESVSYSDQIWEAVVDIRGADDEQAFGSFGSQIEVLDVYNVTGGETSFNNLITGNYPFTNLTTDHFLVRAFKDQYVATGPGDIVYFDWYSLTTSNQDQTALTAREPFDGDVANFDEALLESGLVIQKKIDAVLFVSPYQTLPPIGTQIETTGVFGYVAYTYEDEGSATIYVEGSFGVWPSDGSLQTEVGEVVGEFQRVAPVETTDTSDELGGYWLFTAPATLTVGTTNEDEGRAIAVYNIVPNGKTDAQAVGGNVYDQNNAVTFQNIQTVIDAGTEFSLNNYNSYIRTLTNQGLPGAYGNFDVIPSDLFVVRAPKTVTDKVSAGDTIGLHVVNLPRYSDDSYVDITPTGLTYINVNKTHTVVDVWDGFINFELDNTDSFGNPYEPFIGQIVRDTGTQATAIVTFYQRDSRNATIFVKNVSGTWARGRDFAQASIIEFIGDPTNTDPDYQVTREMGRINHVSLGNANLNIGKMVVLELPVPILTVPTTDTVTGAEYIVYKEESLLGIATSPNVPSLGNLDWRDVYRVPVDPDGFVVNGTNTNLGTYTIFQRLNLSTFDIVGSFIVPETDNNLRLGSNIKITKYQDLYKAFIHAEGDGTSNNPGRIYFLNNGTTPEGDTYNWELAKNKKYRGEFAPEKEYFIDDIVFLDGSFYKALTNIEGAPGSRFITTDWEEIAINDAGEYIGIDYVGFIPNNTDFMPNSDSTLKLDQVGLLSFGASFDVDNSGQVLIVTAKYDSKPNKVIVYRSLNGHFIKDQEIVAENSTMDFGADVTISSDGMLVAISAPFDDDVIERQGAVYVYHQVNGVFELSQRLTSVNGRRKEYFGSTIDFDGNTLFVSAYRADSDKETYFDVHTEVLTGAADIFGSKYVYDTDSEKSATPTTFDNDFTRFASSIDNNGVIYAYDRVDDTLVYGQQIDLKDPEAKFFGRIATAKNNHVYTAMPSYINTDGKKGAVFDFRRNDSSRIWEEYRTSKPVVDLEKIKRVMIYDRSKNEVIENLDYIDPIQGKIAGPADQELRYKTPFDPATYNTGTDIVNVNDLNKWGEAQVGQLWWDLSVTKFINPYQGTVIYSTNNWNKLFNESTVNVYEWVETKLLPSEWDAISGTEQGQTVGVTGNTKYGDDVYVTKKVYDSIAQRFVQHYYYWVGNKTTVPDKEWRSISAKQVADFIKDPAAQGHKFVSFIDDHSFALWNCYNKVKGTDVVLSIQYWTSSDKNSNIHNQYQILTEGLSTSVPSFDVERKWFDSLVGYDAQSRPVPDPNLAPNQRYGILNRPRQGWFVNRQEALKQVIERVNGVLQQNLIVEEKDISRLTESDIVPSEISRLYDVVVDSVIDLDFVGVARATRAELTPVIEDGKIIRIEITNAGRGYKVVPTFEIHGIGTGAEIELSINNLGQIVSAEVIDGGNSYDDNTIITVRRFSALVNSDDTINGKWAIYERNASNRSWTRIISQSYDVNNYWEYSDWYATGYNAFTEVDQVVDYSYSLQGLDDNLGDIIKILNVGGEGWLLLEKVDVQRTTDYTVNYRTIGRQNGTIQFKENLYNLANSQVGFDSQSFDTKFFDSQPIEEIRIILETLRDSILTVDLRDEYNKLFFASLRYVFAEQGYVDWAFKTSFVKAQHNVGGLSERITYKNDSLESYEDYIQEVKPYKTKLREYVSSYDKIEQSQSMVTDFDLPPAYSEASDSIIPNSIKVFNGVLTGGDGSLLEYPNKHWTDNISYGVVAVNVSDPGEGYLTPPVITIESNTGSGATAVASLGPNGTISSIKIISEGTGYMSIPTISINGSLRDGGRDAVLAAQLGNNNVRHLHTTSKFDRVTGAFLITQLNETEVFAGTGAKVDFDLKWPMDERTNTVEITVGGNLILSSQYSFTNIKDTSSDYDRYYGRISLTLPPVEFKEIVVNYKKNISLLSAADRINLFYNPTTGQIGKDISQLMDGVDYGGVQVKSYGFSGPSGWDSDSWYDGSWDLFDENFDEESFVYDGSTTAFPLSKPLASGVQYNVYINDVRIDDNNYDGTSSADLVNKHAFIAPILGDGVTSTLTIENTNDWENYIATNHPTGDVIITIRRNTTDGSLAINDESFDTALQGGDLAYSTAKGLNAEEITVDGDGFVTPTTSKGPEELVPGQIMDTLDITVYERATGGSSVMTSINRRGDGSTKVFDLEALPYSTESLLVKIDYNVIDSSAYWIDFKQRTINFYNAPADEANIHLITMGLSGDNLLDLDTFVSDGSTQEYLTNVRWTDSLSAYVTLDGKDVAYELLQSDNSYEVSGNVVIRFMVAPEANKVIQYSLFESTAQTFSQVTIDEFTADGSTIEFEVSQAPFNQQPSSFFTIVTVDNKVLNPGYSEQFNVTVAQRQYQLKLWQIAVGTVYGEEIEVYLNGRKLEFLQEWTYEGAGSFDPTVTADAQPGSTVILNTGVGVDGDILDVHVITDGEYRFGYMDTNDESVGTFVSTPTTLHLDSAFNDGDVIKVFQFSNHDSQGIERINYDVVERTELTNGTDQYANFRMLKNGLVKLRNPAVSVDYVWVALNGNWLDSSADFVLLENKEYIKFIVPIADDDVIDIIHFANPPVSPKFGFKQFKDMLNRNHYKRLDSEGTYTLAQSLSMFDRVIVLDDATTLPIPKLDSRNPGIIWVEGERIEFYRRDGNELKQLRRGTLGTGVKDSYPVGTTVYNQSIENTAPYKDNTITFNATGGEYIDMSLTYENSPEVTFESITYDFNNNTVFPLGGQVATVIGSGFRPNVQVYVQNVACSTTYVSDTELTFITPALDVGAYDLVIYNDTETTPVDRAATSIVLTKQMKYVQVLLPFAPLPNPISSNTWNSVTETGWYKKEYTADSGIPEEYWEAMDIEVFINGRRLRKNPIKVWNHELGQDSPSGDEWLEAEYAVNKNVGAYVRLTEAPDPKASIVVLKRVGQVWNEIDAEGNYKPLGQSQTEVATFLREKTINLPR
jgi:hypothetical protein